MNNLKAMILNESVEDVALFLIPKIGYPRVDGIYVRHNFDVITSGLLLRTIEKLLKEGKFTQDKNGFLVKGPYWTPPQFVLDKKYGIE